MEAIEVKNTTSFMESKEAIESFRDVFNNLFNTASNKQYLDGVPYWKKEWVHDYQLNNSGLLNGFFINTSSNLPDKALIDSYFFDNPDLDTIIVPNVREPLSRSDLSPYRFKEVDAGFECLHELDSSNMIGALRKKIGSKKARDLIRLQRKANEDYRLDVLTIECVLDSNVATKVDKVFELHERSYGHVARLYGRRYLDEVRKKPQLNEKFRVHLRRDELGNIAQVMLSLYDELTKTLFYIAQAINKKYVIEGNNLYKSSFMDIYDYACTLNANLVNVGRGSQLIKEKQLGANILIKQNHIIIYRT